MQSDKNESYVVLIGGANLDILGFSEKSLIPRDSNPGRVSFCAGGVARNIAENLSRLEIRTELIFAAGSGFDGKYIIENSKELSIGTNHTLKLNEELSSTYMAMMDSDGDMALALSDMSTAIHITAGYLRTKKSIISNADIIVADTNLSAETLDYISSDFPGIPLFIDPVSVSKAAKLKPLLSRIDTLKMNRLEAEAISGIRIEYSDDLHRAADFFIGKGTRRVFITSGGSEIYWAIPGDSGKFTPPAVPVISTTGAGDAFSAAVVFCSLQGCSIEETLRFSSAASGLTLSSEATVSPWINPENVRAFMER